MIYFTADTHFGAQRTLDMSRRPFKTVEEMDMTLVDNINETCKDGILYHLGDFGNHEMVEKIKVPVCLIIGNYEMNEVQTQFFGNFESYRRYLIRKYGYIDVRQNVVLTIDSESVPNKSMVVIGMHKPSDCLHDKISLSPLYKDLERPSRFYLFGHTHGLQKVKKFGIDVGVDAHHYKPIDSSGIIFYKKAIENAYDADVWC